MCSQVHVYVTLGRNVDDQLLVNVITREYLIYESLDVRKLFLTNSGL